MSSLIRIMALAILLALGATAAVGAEPSRDIHQELQSQKADAEPPAGYRIQSSAGYQAQATSNACFNDPNNDTINMNNGASETYPKADLVQWCAAYVTNGDISLSHKNATPTSPTADPNWVNGLTGLLWDVDVNGDHVGEYGVYYFNTGNGVVVEVERYSDGAVVCEGQAGYDGMYYDATFKASCVGSPNRFWSDAFMMYDSQWDDQYAPIYADIADTFGGPVEAQASSSPPPASPTQPQPAPSGSSKYFADVTSGPHVANIDFMYEQGLVNGCGTDPLRYCPSANMTRAQMATILARYIQQN